ncbi:MAG: class II fructose-bisphosphate aldolase [Planctomycetales bacterium]|nr:class II fructose-bisphosphate aldolase [Planctomycetales bacterium]MBN8627996.1 class II fructose-bisphosphate aldolase [Planctomycetota bacterium]
MIVTTKDLFEHAYGKYAVGAYNINNLEQTIGLFRGNLGKKDKNEEPVRDNLAAPFIIQLSRGARGYTDKRYLESMIRTSEEVFPEAIFAVHLDHGTEEVCYECIDSGFYSSVMIDASHEDFDKNIEITRRVVDRAHAKGISVEAELGMLGGVEEDISVDAEHACLTDPDQAVEFVERSGCDSLAVAIGTSHGAYKFKGSQSLHFDRIEAIQKTLPNFPLVMHGSSSVPKEWVDRINKAGGNMPDTSGVREGDYLPAAKLGVTKVNIDTDGRLVWCAVYRETFRDKPADFDPRTAGKPFMAAYADYIIHKNQMLGSSGQLEGVRQSLTSKV